MNWFLPDQKKPPLSRAYRDLPITMRRLSYPVVIEQQCFDCIRDTAALLSSNFPKSTLNEGERIARARVQRNNIDMHMHVRPISCQTAKQCSICLLT